MYYSYRFSPAWGTGASVSVDVLRGTDNVVLAAAVASGTDLAGLSQLSNYTGSIRLRANFVTNNPVVTVLLQDWRVDYDTTVAPNNYTSVKTGNWNDQTVWSPQGIPSAGDNVTIAGVHQVTITGIACQARNITITASARLIFTITQTDGSTVGSPQLLIDNGGAISNVGTISALGTSALYPAVISSSGIAYWGWSIALPGNNVIPATGVALQYFTLANLIYYPQLITYQNRLTLSGSFYASRPTGSVDTNCIIISDFEQAVVTLSDNALLQCSGSISNYGYFILRPGSRMEMERMTSGQEVHIRNYANGVITATGTSASSRDCRIYRTSNSVVGSTYILYFDTGSATFLQNCDISGMRGIYSLQVLSWSDGARIAAGAVWGQGLTVDNCDIHDSYAAASPYSYGLWLDATASGMGNIITNNRIWNINSGSTHNVGISLQATSGVTHNYTIMSNTIHSITGGTNMRTGVAWENNSCAIGSGITFVNNAINSCIYGISGWATAATAIRMNIWDSNLSIVGQNHQDITMLNNPGIVRIYLRNCLLNSANEVQGTTISVNDCWVHSRRHDNTPGLVRIWGDYHEDNTGLGGSYQYATTLFTQSDNPYSPGSGDAGVQKIIEFGPSVVPARTVDTVTMPAGTRYWINYSGWELAMTGTAGAPVLVRSLTGQTNPYGFYIWRTAATIPRVSMDYVEFQHLNADGLCLGGRPVAAERGKVEMNSFTNITFKNNNATAGARHLTMRTGTTQTFTVLSFDSSTTNDVTTGDSNPVAASIITFTNWNVGRPAPVSTTTTAGSYCVWTPYGANRISLYSSGVRDWTNPAVWDPEGVPGPDDTVTIRGTAIYEIPATTTVYTCRSLTIEASAYLRFRPDGYVGTNPTGWGGGDITFRVANGGAIGCLATAPNTNIVLRNTGGSTYNITLETANSADARPFVYAGPDIYWNLDNESSTQDNVGWRLRGIDFRQPSITFAQPDGVTIIGDLWTREVNIRRSQAGGGATVTFNPLATATWLARGFINVGNDSAGSDGVLNIVGENDSGANLVIACTSTGQFGLIVTGFGTLTA
ncbi:MAG: hypothetical protein QME51_06985, partial [Planctomycetota bacterium]|nr:hypothetical protein [Planctomycetota bacterium]